MVKSISIVIYIACLSTSFDIWTQCELFTAVSLLEPLIETQKVFIDNLEDYIDRKVSKLHFMINCVENMKVEEKKIKEMQLEDYFGDPFNSYKIIKRLSSDLAIIELGVVQYIRPIPDKILILPSKEDMDGVATALVRIQTVYNLTISNIVDGVLNGVYSTPLTTGDCYAIARTLYDLKDFKTGVKWMLLAYEKYTKTDHGMYPFDKEDITEHITHAYHELDEYKNALEWLNRLQALKSDDPSYASTAELKKFLEDRINQEELDEMRKKTLGMPELKTPEDKKKVAALRISQNYEKLCRGERGLSKKVIKRLKCRYLTKTHPFLKLAPVKMEQLYIKPDIVLFYEMLSDRDMEQIVNISKSRLQTGRTGDPKLNDGPARYRTCKVAFLTDDMFDVIARLSRRVSEITGFTTDDGEDLHVLNYGVGGHYQNHYDFCLDKKLKDFNQCRRLATVIFYLSEVAQGGATIFPKLGLTVRPLKGAALFWVNLHRSGEGDLATLHAACPVIHGTKWIANKWIHEAGQELTRPCTLNYQKEGIIHYIPRPVRKKKL